MNKRLTRLQRLVDLAELGQRRAAQTVAEARAHKDQNETQLEQFRRYHAEYAAALKTRADAVTASEVRELKQFISQLEHTINILDERTAVATDCYERSSGDWQRETRRTEALQEVVARKTARHERELEDQAQRELDDRRLPQRR